MLKRQQDQRYSHMLKRQEQRHIHMERLVPQEPHHNRKQKLRQQQEQNYNLGLCPFLGGDLGSHRLIRNHLLQGQHRKRMEKPLRETLRKH